MKKLAEMLRSFSAKKLIVIIAIVIGFIWGLNIYSDSLNAYLKEEAVNRLLETAHYNGAIVRGELKEKQVRMRQIVYSIETADDIHSGESKAVLERIFQHDSFDRVGLIYANGTVDMLNEQGSEAPVGTNLVNQRFFIDGMKGKESIVRINDKLIFSMPVKDASGGIIGVLFASYKADYLSDAVTLDIFEGRGYSLIIDRFGNKVISSANVDSALSGVIGNDSNNVFINQFKFNENAQDFYNALYPGMRDGKSGLLKVDDIEKRYVYYQPLGIDDLYLLTLIPRNIVENRYDILMSYTYLLFIFLILLCAGFILYLLISEGNQQKKLKDIIYIDDLTKGYSYERFHREADEWLKRSDEKKALIALDVDNFKLINTMFGYQKGNEILIEIWKILDHDLQGRGIVARKYADLFSIMVGYDSVRDLDDFCRRAAEHITALRIADRKSFRIIPSMGVYIVGSGKEDLDLDLIQNNAIMARRTIKNQYDKYYVFYKTAMKQEILYKKSVIDDIGEALNMGEFKPYFQPQYDAKTKEMVGAEALIRWIKPDGSIVAPFKFIPIAEEMGVIVDIDDYMFNMVCSYQHYWQKQGRKTVPISVNVSRNRLYMPGFIQDYKAVLSRYGLDTKCIQLEITEGTLFAELKIGEQLVRDIREAGFDVLIDDFGMGYSSISMVKDINASKLKIDKSFIDDMSDKGRQMIRYVIKIANTMNMRTVAEGVETKEQYEFLRDNNCDSIQGYYFAKPMPSEEFEKLLH